MNIKASVAATVAAVALSLGMAGCKIHAASEPVDFIKSCQQSLNAVADWARIAAERRGREFSGTMDWLIAEKIASTCQCANDELKANLADHEWSMAGQLVGIQARARIMMTHAGRNRKAADWGDFQREYMMLVARSGGSPEAVEVVTQKVKRALNSCRRG
ncbi:MAG: hypothetical protein RLZ98_369 [Pseudomonadota bacterium]|jgi:hypothetical protein